MAKNRIHEHGTQIGGLKASVVSGDAVVIGQIPGVALNSVDALNKFTMQCDGVFELSVKGVDGGGNVAVNNGDIIYYVEADTPKLSKKVTGVRYGYAWDPNLAGGAQLIASGATATIKVKIGY